METSPPQQQSPEDESSVNMSASKRAAAAHPSPQRRRSSDGRPMMIRRHRRQNPSFFGARYCALVILLACTTSRELWRTTTDSQSSPSPSSWLFAQAANDDYYNENFGDDGANNNQYYGNYNNYNNNNNNNQQQQYNYNNYNNNQNNPNNNGNGGDDYYNYNYNDDGYNNMADDDGNNNNNANGDDANAAAAYDDYNNFNGNDDANNGAGDDYANANAYNQDDAYKNEQEQYQNHAADDDTFHWNDSVGFGGVSVMPVSCINYNNGHMIKFQLFDTEQSYQCHFAEISTFVVSIAHYMRAYFNYQALSQGKDYVLPDDAAFLNCIQLNDISEEFPLYAKIGCMERETFTSTKLQLRVYTDSQCSQPYDDGRSARKHATRGYVVGDYEISSEVSFKVPFYSCMTCAPEQVSGTFNKKNGNWYDDDYISMYGTKQGQNEYKYNQQQNGNGNNDDANGNGDDYNAADDQYMSVNDDVGQYDDDAKYQNGNNNNVNNQNYNGGNNNYNNNQYNYNQYNNNGDDGRRLLHAAELSEEVNTYTDEFWRLFDQMQNARSLYDNYYDIGEWNMCQRIYKYGVWCDEECRSLDFFRTDQWSGSDVFLLSIMCTFLSGMMLLIVAKRLKAQQKARMYGDDQPLPGLPPFGMAIIFCVIMAVVITLAKLRFVNETLVFAVVTCILLFIYMLKLTLFENRRPVLLAAPRHDMFDNPLDDHLFD